MKKNLPFKKIAITTLLFCSIYFGFRHNEDSNKTDYAVKKKREKFNKFLDEHPYNNRNIDVDNYRKIPKKDRPDLAAEQNYFMMVDPNTLTVPYEEVAKGFELIHDRFQEIKQYKSTIQSNGNSILNNKTGFFEVNDNYIPSDAIIVNGEPVVWKEIGPDNVGGRTRAILWDPNDPTNRRVFAAGVTGGIWVNDNVLDPNSSWRAVNDMLATLSITHLVADPNNTQTFYAGTGEGWFGGGSVRGIGIFKSTDAGKTWSLLSSTSGSEFAYIQKIQITASGTILAATRAVNGTDGGIFRSTDDGVSFTRVLNTRGVDIEIAANGDIYASRGIFTSGSVFKSTDDGVNWADVTPPGGVNPGRIEMATAPTDANIIYAIASNTNAVFAGSDNDTDWVQKSTDGGATWTNLSIPVMNQFCGTTQQHLTRGQSWYDLILAVSPTNPDVVVIGGVDMARSEDGGQTWSQISRWSNENNPCDGIAYVHADIHNIVFRPNHPSEALIGSDGGLDYSPNLGIAPSPTFAARDKNFTTTQFYAVATDNIANSNYYIGGTQDNGTQQLTSELGFSSVEVWGGDGAFAHVDQLDRNFQLVASQNGRSAHSSNGGISFSNLTTLGTGNFINQSDYDNTSGILYSTADNDEIALIRDLKTDSPSEEVATSIDLGGRQTSTIRANTNVANRLFVGTEGGIIYKIDDANLDTPVITDITSNITSVGNVSSIDVGSSDMELIATYSNFGITSVWYSIDGGTTWINKDEAEHGLPNIPIRWALFNPNNTNQVLLATELGIWSTNDITAINPNWEPSNEGLANVRCDMIQYREVDGMIVVATHGRGFYTSNIFTENNDTDAPVITALNPTDDETAATPLDANLEIQFNEAINIGTGNIGLYLINDDSLVENISVTSSQVSISGSRAIINPTNDLAALTAYYITIDAGTFKDNFDNDFAGISESSTWNFTTFDGDIPPVVNIPIADISVNENSDDININLSDVFNDIDNDNSNITYTIFNNSNNALVNTNLTESDLTLSFIANKIGASQITIRATSNGKTVDDTFNVTSNSTAISLFNQPGPPNGSGRLEGVYNNTTNQNVEDFIVPGGQNWDISTVTSFGFSLGEAVLNLQNVSITIYDDNEGAPGSIVEQQTILNNQGQIIGGTQNSPSLTVRLNSTINLTSGNYWFSILPTFDVSAGTDSSTALFAWYTSANDGNSYAGNGSGTFTSQGFELLFSIDGVATITDETPTVANPIDDIALLSIPDPNPMVIDLTNTFTDADNDDDLITLEVTDNTNTSFVTASISGKELSLNYSGSFDMAQITIKATSNGLSVEDSFIVSLPLYGQTGIVEGTSSSQIFPDFADQTIQTADNFEIPIGETWDISSVSVEGSISSGAPELAVFTIHEDDNGLPGNEIFNSGDLNVVPTNDSSDFIITTDTPASLSSGIYWVSVRTNQAFNPGSNQWFWFFTTPAVNGDYMRQSPTELAGTATTWTDSGNNGALIFSLFGSSEPTLSTADFNENELRLLANPTNGVFEVQMRATFSSDLKVAVYDLAGRTVKKQSVEVNQQNFTLDLTKEANGIYIMKILNEGKTKMFKIIKK